MFFVFNFLKMYCDWPEFGRFCFCFPLRIGVLVFGYAGIVFNAFLIGVYSYAVHKNLSTEIVIMNYGVQLNFPAEMCIAFFCADVIFKVLLVYGAHKLSLTCIKAYYYYALSSLLATVLLQIADVAVEKIHMGVLVEMLTFTFVTLCIQVYLITIVRSLLKKMEKSGPHVYDNQLHQIVTGEFTDINGIYNNTTIAPTEI